MRALEGASQLGAIPVNVDARESDLAALTEAQLNELAASPQRKLASASTQDSRAISYYSTVSPCGRTFCWARCASWASSKRCLLF